MDISGCLAQDFMRGILSFIADAKLFFIIYLRLGEVWLRAELAASCHAT